jgi:hypothetical protein
VQQRLLSPYVYLRGFRFLLDGVNLLSGFEATSTVEEGAERELGDGTLSLLVLVSAGSLPFTGRSVLTEFSPTVVLL